jgi:hypothetical protein
MAINANSTLDSLISAPNSTAWRPPQWKTAPPMFMVTIKGSQNAPADQFSAVTPESGVPGDYLLQQTAGTEQIYVFDAVITADHRQDATITSFPVQTGAAISDHAYIMPAEITLDIGMSDAMEAYASSTSADVAYAGGAWTLPGSLTKKSVSAYATMLSWAQNRVLMSLTTRLFTYPNVMVASLAPQENAGTIASLRCRVTFKQIFLANIQTLSPSARPQDTQNTGQGQASGGTPSNAQVSQYGSNAGANVPTSGPWSSNASALAVA